MLCPLDIRGHRGHTTWGDGDQRGYLGITALATRACS